MINLAVLILYLEKYYSGQTAFILHITGSMVTILFNNKILKYDKEKEDESTSN